MKAAWYERQGAASSVLVVGEMPTPRPGEGEVRIRVYASGINPGDIKKRQDAFAVGMPFQRVIPHSDGAGVIEEVGSNVSTSRIGERVWCFGAQSYRPFGTAAEFAVVPAAQAIHLPSNTSFEQGACLGIPGITGHRAIDVGNVDESSVVLVQGGAGAVAQCAIVFAAQAGAEVIATVRSAADMMVARSAGAKHVIDVSEHDSEAIIDLVRAYAHDGVDHIVEVAFDKNVKIDERLLRIGGSIAAFATGNPMVAIPFWPLLFKNVTLYFLGSDDFPDAAKVAAALALNRALEGGWQGFDIGARFSLDEIAEAHDAVEQSTVSGRVLLDLPGVK